MFQEKPLQEGDLVLLQRCHWTGRHKLEDKYEEDPYTVMSIPHGMGDVVKISKPGYPAKVVNRWYLIRDVRDYLSSEEEDDAIEPNVEVSSSEESDEENYGLRKLLVPIHNLRERGNVEMVPEAPAEVPEIVPDPEVPMEAAAAAAPRAKRKGATLTVVRRSTRSSYHTNRHRLPYVSATRHLKKNQNGTG